MGRRDVVDALNRIAFCAEVLGDDAAGGKAYGAASWQLRSADGDFQQLWESGQLAQLPGVGEKVLAVVDAVMKGEKVPLLEELGGRVPAGLFEIKKIPGLGAKKIKTLWAELDITTLGELEYACDENRLLELKGFGKKTQEKVKAAIADARRTEGHLRVDQMAALGDELVERLALDEEIERVAVTGGVRRALETLHTLDVVVLASDDERAVIEEALDLEGDPSWDEHDAGMAVLTAPLSGTPCRVWLCTEEDGFGAALLSSTGSDEHVAAVRAHAEQRGLRLDAGGLWRGDERVPCDTEEALYEALELVATAPERREVGVPLVHVGTERPRLLRRGDLVGALHNHTTASDGVNTLEEMRAAAAELGLVYLGITEHSETASYAGGLSAERLAAQREQIEALNEGANEAGEGCLLLSGVESDILDEGRLDYPDDVLRPLDVVVASVHNRMGQSGDPLTERMRAAAQHPMSDVIGHPTGRLLLGRPAAAFDVEAMLDACAQAGTAVELNSNPARLDLNEEHLAAARERGVLVSIAADAHSTEGLRHLDWGVRIARRAGLTAADVLNARPLDELRAWLRERRQRAGVEA